MKQITGGVCAPQGFKAGGTACGIKKNGKPDLALIYSEAPATAAGIFTLNKVQAAPVLLSKKHLQNPEMRAIIANSGNANACMGPEGIKSARIMAASAATALGINTEEVLVASTGVIGQPLPVEKITARLEQGVEFISADNGHAAAEAIMTTDTFSKEAAVEFQLSGRTVRIGGTAKGSGMIHPNMATMLGFLTTDAAVAPEMLYKALLIAGDRSFNRITVDGDTSTNDCLFILANGQAGNSLIAAEDADFNTFLEALTVVCVELAQLIAKDGEGATKFVTITVNGAASEAEAVRAGKAVATSNLVKTALFGEDANWGRILCAVGYSGVDFDPEKVDIFLGDLLVCRGGMGLAFDEDKAKRILSEKEIQITITMDQGNASATVWTCDLSYDYVKINGSYRT